MLTNGCYACPPVQVTHARARDTFEGTFECRACGFEAPALVYGGGRGSARGWDQDSAAAAIAEAQEDASDVASWTLAFLPCPSCGKRDPIARSYVITAVILALLGGSGGGALFAVLAVSRGVSFGNGMKLFAVATGVLVALAIFGAKARAFISIRRRVSLDMTRASGVPPASVVRR